MQRITISLDDALGEALDQMVGERSYASRSEAMRDIVRSGLEQWRAEEDGDTHCVANLSYIVDSRVRSLPPRLLEMQHAHHDLIIASTVARLDHHHSLESVMLKGAVRAVHAFADAVRSARGIRFGAINLLRVSPTDRHHGDGHHVHDGHHHLSPLD